MPVELLDAVKAKGPADRHYDPKSSAVMSLIRQLATRRDLTEITVDKPGFRLDLRQASHA